MNEHTFATLTEGVVADDPAPEYIDLTPTWAGIMPGLLDAWTNVIPENERIMREEFQRVALAADRYNAVVKAYRAFVTSEKSPEMFAETLLTILYGDARCKVCGDAITGPDHSRSH